MFTVNSAGSIVAYLLRPSQSNSISTVTLEAKIFDVKNLLQADSSYGGVRFSNLQFNNFSGSAIKIKIFIIKMLLISLLVTISQAGMAAWSIGNSISVGQGSEVVTVAKMRIDDDISLPDDFPIDPDPDPEPQCTADSRTYTVDNSLLDLFALLLADSRLQISHTRESEPIVGEPRTINLTKGISSSKFQLLESAQEQRCNQQPNPGQCMIDWYQKMNETVVYTIEPEYHSYVDWSDSFETLTGLSYTPVPVPIIEKPVQSKVSKAVTSLFILPIAINVDKARCHINQIESIFNIWTHPIDIRNGRLEIGFPLESVGTPTLKCEGRAVALWGLHTWGWADNLFPDITLKNMRLNASFGDFRIVDKLPMFNSVIVNVEANLDLNNIPGFGESIISFFKDYSGKVRKKVADALRKELKSKTVREAFGRALVSLVEERSGDQVERICAVRAMGETLDIEYETVSITTPVLISPVKVKLFWN